MENELSTNFQITPNFVMDSMLNPQIFEQLQRASTLFSKSGLVPDNFKNNPAACFVGLQLAGAIGCNPFMLFQGMYSIGGKIGLETKLAVAIANQKGVFSTPITHKFTGEGKTRSCTATATLAKSKKEVSITVDWEMVEKEGWNKKNGSKWNTMPDQMFRYRSSMWLIRTYAPEVLMGLNSLDELEDSKIIDVTPSKTKTIDTAFAEIANTKPENAIDAPKIPTGEVSKATFEQPKEEIAKDNNVPSKQEETKDDKEKAILLEQILSYGSAPSVLTVYIVKSIGTNKNINDLTCDEARKVLSYIQNIKGVK